MKLQPFVTTERVIIGLEPGDRKSILEQLIQPLVDSDCISDTDLFIKDLEEREDQVTTVLENGVAFPHARSTAVTRLCMTVGIAGEGGVVLNSGSDVKTPVFFCIGVPSRTPTAHMPILQTLANYVKDEKRLERLAACTTGSQVVRCLANYKG